MTTYMYNTFLRGISLAIVALGIFLGATVARAERVDDLEVLFNGTASSTAMFGETNFLPGDIAVGTAHVTNHGNAIEEVHTDTIFEADPDHLGDHMTLIITDDDDPSNTWYNGSFGDFLDGGEVSLGTIAPNETIVYAYTVIFEDSTGNDMQEKSLSFDVCVGFEDPNGYVCGTQISDGEDDDDDDNGGGGSGGGGGGGGGGIIESSPLKIMNERVEGITLPQATAIGLPDGTAIIKWETYRNGGLEPATSQVIYGVKTHGNGSTATGYPYSINLTQPNFGYPEATVEDTNKVTHHEVLLTGLEVGATYAYRVVSHASPATVSYQHGFTIPWGVGGDDSYLPEDGGDGNGGGNPILADGGTTGGGTYTPPEPEYILEGGDEEMPADDGNGNGLLPAALGFLPASMAQLLMCAFWFILAIIIMLIIWRLYRAWRKKGGYDVKVEEDLRLWILTDVVAIIILYLFHIYCPIIPLAILLLVLIIWCIKRRLGRQSYEAHVSQTHNAEPTQTEGQGQHTQAQ